MPRIIGVSAEYKSLLEKFPGLPAMVGQVIEKKVVNVGEVATRTADVNFIFYRGAADILHCQKLAQEMRTDNIGLTVACFFLDRDKNILDSLHWTLEEPTRIYQKIEALNNQGTEPQYLVLLECMRFGSKEIMSQWTGLPAKECHDHDLGIIVAEAPESGFTELIRSIDVEKNIIVDYEDIEIAKNNREIEYVNKLQNAFNDLAFNFLKKVIRIAAQWLYIFDNFRDKSECTVFLEDATLTLQGEDNFYLTRDDKQIILRLIPSRYNDKSGNTGMECDIRLENCSLQDAREMIAKAAMVCSRYYPFPELQRPSMVDMAKLSQGERFYGDIKEYQE